MAQETIENIEEAEGDSAANSGKYVSERGPFEIWENPAITPPESADGLDNEQVTMGLDMSALAAKYGEEAVRQKAGEMVKAFAPGTGVRARHQFPGPVCAERAGRHESDLRLVRCELPSVSP